MSDGMQQEKLLIVDNDPGNIRVLRETLRNHYQLFFATSGQEALDVAIQIQPDLVLLDIQMPEMDGYEVCRAMQADPLLKHSLIIFVSALSGEEDESVGLTMGAVDYITKPFRPAIVRQRVSIHLELKRQREHQISAIKQSLLASEERYRALFKNLMHGFVYCRLLFNDSGESVDFIFLEVNNAFDRLTGRQGVVGKRVSEIFPGIRDAYPELFASFDRVVKTGNSEAFELEFKPLDTWLTLAMHSNEPDCCCITFDEVSRRKQLELELQLKLKEIKVLKQQVEAENVYLRAEIRDRLENEEIIGASPALRTVLAQAEQLAKSTITVLLQGETGTGKELVANYVHRRSNRSGQSLYKLSCAAIPTSLMESELFGHERGAFTGATERRIGHFELADRATIFLDEIGEIPLEAQAKLLRVLQEGEFCRVGGTRILKTDVRVIAATNRDLAEEVRQGRFREDLYYRLGAFPLTVPSLRERTEDIPQLVWAFVHELGARMGKSITRISAQKMMELQRYSWPGNIRELRNVIEHALIFSRSDTLEIRIPTETITESRSSLTLAEVEYQHIVDILRSTNGRVDGPHGAARLLGLNPNTLHSRMRKLGIKSSRKICYIKKGIL